MFCPGLGNLSADVPALDTTPVARMSCCLAYVPTPTSYQDHVHLARVAPPGNIPSCPIMSHSLVKTTSQSSLTPLFRSLYVSACLTSLRVGRKPSRMQEQTWHFRPLLISLPTRLAEVPHHYRLRKAAVDGRLFAALPAQVNHP